MKKVLKVIAAAHTVLRYVAIGSIALISMMMVLISIMVGFSAKLLIACVICDLSIFAGWVAGSVFLHFCRKLVVKFIHYRSKKQESARSIKWITLSETEGMAADKESVRDVNQE